MFQGYLGPVEIQELTDAALSGGVFDMERSLWFEHVHRGFVAGLRRSPQPSAQFKLDLAKVNTVERLEDGSIPLERFLSNIAGLLRLDGMPEAAVFARHANQAGNRAHGVKKMPSVATLPEIVRKEAIGHQDDTVAFGFLASALLVGRSVGRISVPRFDNGTQRMLGNGRPWIMNGTGWLIGADLLVTNHHVVNARDATETTPASTSDLSKQAVGSTVVFDFDAEGAQGESISVKALEAVNDDLDYAILRLASIPSQRPPLRLGLDPVTMTAATYLPLNVIQHPRGLPKRIAFRNNLLSGADNDVLRYFTDTDFGTSGAPVCDDTWRVVALHRGAEQAQNVMFQGKETAFVNFGTQISRLLQDLRVRSSSLLAEVIAAQPVQS